MLEYLRMPRLPASRRLSVWTAVLVSVAIAQCASAASTGAVKSQAQALEASPANATSANAGARLQEVLVTARRRTETAQTVPMALTVLTPRFLSNIGFKNITSLKEKVPSLDITPDNNTPTEMVLFIRGIGGADAEQLTRDNGVGVYIDGVYEAHGMMLASQLLDVARVEIIRGPAGVLYGRNTIGGAINFISIPPTGRFDFKESLDAGNYGYVRNFASVDLPRVANVSVKLSGLFSHTNGWVKNSGTAGDFGRDNDVGARAAVRWQPTADLTIDYAFDHSNQHGTPDVLQWEYPDYVFGFDFRAPVASRQSSTWRPVNFPQSDWFIGSGNALTVNWSPTQQIKLTSITGYRQFNGGFWNDTAEGFNFAYVQAVTTNYHQFSEELRLTGSTLRSQLHYVLGLFYFKEGGLQLNYLDNNFAAQTVVPYVPPTLADVNLDCYCWARNYSKAVYADATWRLPVFQRRLSIEVGGRDSWDWRAAQRHRPYAAPFPTDDSNEIGYSSFDPAYTIDFRLSSRAHVYAKRAQAYEAGGFDSFNNDVLKPYNPEHVVSYEVGLKSEPLPHRVLFNIDVFDESYTDLQEIFYDPNYAGGAQVTVNAGDAKSKGVESDIEVVPFDGFLLQLHLSHLETTQTTTNPFTFVTLTSDLYNAPRWKGNLSVDYTIGRFRSGTLSAFVDYSYNGPQLDNQEPPDDVLPYRPGYSLLDGRLTFSDIQLGEGSLDVSLWGTNLTDKAYQTYHAFGSVQWGWPRTYGANLTYRFSAGE